MSRKLRKCPNCDVALKECKESAVLLTRRHTSGQVWIQVAPLDFGLTVRPYSCPMCGLVQLYGNRQQARASRTALSAWPSPSKSSSRRVTSLLM